MREKAILHRGAYVVTLDMHISRFARSTAQIETAKQYSTAVQLFTCNTVAMGVSNRSRSNAILCEARPGYSGEDQRRTFLTKQIAEMVTGV